METISLSCQSNKNATRIILNKKYINILKIKNFKYYFVFLKNKKKWGFEGWLATNPLFWGSSRAILDGTGGGARPPSAMGEAASHSF
jgi:hypothetical protein